MFTIKGFTTKKDVGEHRITSYNVCYTKLLRGKSGEQPGCQRNPHGPGQESGWLCSHQNR